MQRKRLLDLRGRAAEALVNLAMARGCFQVVAEHQAHDAPTDPDAFGLTRHAPQHLRCLDHGIDLLRGRLFPGFSRRLLFGRAATLSKEGGDCRESKDTVKAQTIASARRDMRGMEFRFGKVLSIVIARDRGQIGANVLPRTVNKPHVSHQSPGHSSRSSFATRPTPRGSAF